MAHLAQGAQEDRTCALTSTESQDTWNTSESLKGSFEEARYFGPDCDEQYAKVRKLQF